MLSCLYANAACAPGPLGFSAVIGPDGNNANPLSHPKGLVVNSDGLLFVASQGNNTVQLFTASFVNLISPLYSKGLSPTWNSPTGIAIDSSNNVYITDSGNNQAEAFSYSLSYAYIGQFGNAGVGDGQFSTPMGIAVDSTGTPFVVDNGNSRVEGFNWDAGSGAYMCNTGGGSVIFDGSPSYALSGPTNIAIDGSDNMYVVDSLNSMVKKFSAGGAFQTLFGGAGSGNGDLSSPAGIAIDASGNIYVVDGGNNRIQKFSSAGGYLAQYGQTGSGNGQFSSPYGIFILGSSLYVTDSNNNRVVIIPKF